MALQFGNAPSANRSVKVGPGVYVNKGVIATAQIEYDAYMIENSQYKPDDVALRLTLDQDGVDWKKELYIGGRYKKEGSPQGGLVVSGWGSAFRVARVFDVLGIKGEINDLGQFHKSAVDALIGREIFFLQYVKGLSSKTEKPSYSDYRLIDARQSEEETDEEVAARIFEQWSKDFEGGFVKNYRPEVLEEESGDGVATASAPAVDTSLDDLGVGWG